VFPRANGVVPDGAARCRLLENAKSFCEKCQSVRRCEDQASCVGRGLRILDFIRVIAAEGFVVPATLPNPLYPLVYRPGPPYESRAPVLGGALDADTAAL
jgi:hypothetical protein